MLIRFAVENFLCFGERTVLDLSSPSPSPSSITLLQGETAAGKSSLQKALAGVRNLVLGGSRPGQPLPITSNLLLPSGPSRFEISLQHDGARWTYGFAATVKRIEEEWLRQEVAGVPRSLYTRRGDPGGSAPTKIELLDVAAGDRQRLELVAYGTRPEQLFLNEALRRGVTSFAPVGVWLRDRLQLILPTTKVVGLAARAAREPAFADFLSQYLESAQTGVIKLEVRREPLAADTFENEEEERELLTALTSFPDAFAETPDGELIAEQDGRLVDLYRVRLICTLASKNGARAELPLAALSDGTQRLLHLLPILHTRVNEPVFFVDDLDRGVSTKLAQGLLARFAERGAQAGQLIATVNDVTPFGQLSPSPRIQKIERTASGVAIAKS